MPVNFAWDTYQPNTGTIADLILRQGSARAEGLRRAGEAQARAQEASGQIWGQAAGTIGQLAGGAVQQISQQQMAQKREQAIGAAMRAVLNGDAGPDAILATAGPDDGPKILNGLQAYRELAEKKVTNARDTAGRLAAGMLALPQPQRAQLWPNVRTAAIQGGLGDEQTIPAEPSDDYLHAVVSWASGKAPEQKQPGTRQITVRNADGSESIQIVPDTPGQTFRSEPAPKVPKTFPVTVNVNGRPVRKLFTEEQLAQGVEEYKPPSAAAQPSRFWVMRDGKPIRVSEAEYVRGDAPLDTKAGAQPVAEMPSEYQTALNRAIGSIPAIRRGTWIQTANRLWQEGNQAELKDVIRQAAVESEPVDVRNQVMGRMATIASLKDTQQILQEMKAAGVPTNWFSGSLENLVRRVGKTTDPRYVELANRLMGTLINYRRAATGVQFSAIESKQYERMFPNYKNELPVNEALIRGLLREMATYDKAYWEHKVGKDGASLLGVLSKDSQGSAPAGALTYQDYLNSRKKPGGE